MLSQIIIINGSAHKIKVSFFFVILMIKYIQKYHSFIHTKGKKKEIKFSCINTKIYNSNSMSDNSQYIVHTCKESILKIMLFKSKST